MTYEEMATSIEREPVVSTHGRSRRTHLPGVQQQVIGWS